MDEIVNCKQYTETLPDGLWRSCLPFVEDAASYGHREFSAEDIYYSILRGDKQLWVVTVNSKIEFVWVTMIKQQPARKIVIVYAAAGTIKYGLEFWPWMSVWMQGNNIEEAEVYCRPSMSRLLKKHGLTPRYEVLCIDSSGEIK